MLRDIGIIAVGAALALACWYYSREEEGEEFGLEDIDEDVLTDLEDQISDEIERFTNLSFNFEIGRLAADRVTDPVKLEELMAQHQPTVAERPSFQIPEVVKNLPEEDAKAIVAVAFEQWPMNLDDDSGDLVEHIERVLGEWSARQAEQEVSKYLRQ